MAILFLIFALLIAAKVEHGNFKLWEQELSDRWGKASKLARFGIVVSLSLIFFLEVWPWNKAYKAAAEAAELKEKNVQLRQEKSDIIQTNQHLLSLVDPIRRMYPDLELAAALAQVTRDLERVQRLAEEPKYKPFSEDLCADFVSRLSVVKNQFPDFRIGYTGFQPSGRNGARVEAQLLSCFLQAGIPVKTNAIIMLSGGNPNHDVLIEVNQVTVGAFIGFSNALASVMELKNAGIYRARDTNAAQIELTIYSTPRFQSDGRIKFD